MGSSGQSMGGFGSSGMGSAAPASGSSTQKGFGSEEISKMGYGDANKFGAASTPYDPWQKSGTSATTAPAKVDKKKKKVVDSSSDDDDVGDSDDEDAWDDSDEEDKKKKAKKLKKK